MNLTLKEYHNIIKKVFTQKTGLDLNEYPLETEIKQAHEEKLSPFTFVNEFIVKHDLTDISKVKIYY